MSSKLLFTLFALWAAALRVRAADPILLPNGLAITPTAAPHSILMPLNPGVAGRPKLTLGQAVTTALNADGSLLLVLTSGYNREGQAGAARPNEYVFVFDAASYPPRQLQALPVPNSFCGVAWNPNGREFYVSVGVDDNVYVFARSGALFSRVAAIAMGHAQGNGLYSNAPAPLNAAAPKPMAAGVAVDPAGAIGVVANFYNDSVSIIDLKARRVTAELDLRPGVQDMSKTGVPGGEYPYWVAIGADHKAYVSSPRDRELVAVRVDSTPTITARISLPGQPNRILLNHAGDRLFAAVDNADVVAVVDTQKEQVVAKIGITAPEAILPGQDLPKGANPNNLALSPDERTLYVTNGGTNAVAVVSLDASGSGRVAGLIPTGWYPNSVSISADGGVLYVVNGKSVPGPNPGNCRGDARAPKIPDCAKFADNYVYNLEKASLMAAPVPGAAELAALTRRAVENNRFEAVRAATVGVTLSDIRSRIQHVIYVIKENRTYDQVLGDLEVGDGDPSLTEFPEPLTPNHHALARKFVTLDNFLDSGEVSGVGWNWSTAARTTDYTEKTVPIEYAGRGLTYDWEGTNRNVNVGIGSLPERVKAQPLLAPAGVAADPNLLPGTADVAAPDAPLGEPGGGYLWDEALRAGLTVRNYGVFCDLSRYENPEKNPGFLPVSKTPFAAKMVQAVPANRSLAGRTDLYFRSFDQNNADFYIYQEWAREFDQFVMGHNLPNLSLVRLAHDHFGSFGTALYGINTPALQITDNDYALGLLVQKVAGSPFRDNTLIFVVEDDAQDGPDHVDTHRSIAYVIGPYVKQGAVVSERYTTVSMVRTIEAVLGLAPSSLQSAASAPMTEVFDMNQSAWSYTPLIPELLRTSQLPLPAPTAENSLSRSKRVLAYAKDRHPAAYWQKRLGDMDFDEEDKLDTRRFNAELWKGMMGNKPYPKHRSGHNLRENRAALLASYE